jgi:hypothetical protein
MRNLGGLCVVCDRVSAYPDAVYYAAIALLTLWMCVQDSSERFGRNVLARAAVCLAFRLRVVGCAQADDVRRVEESGRVNARAPDVVYFLARISALDAMLD